MNISAIHMRMSLRLLDPDQLGPFCYTVCLHMVENDTSSMKIIIYFQLPCDMIIICEGRDI